MEIRKRICGLGLRDGSIVGERVGGAREWDGGERERRGLSGQSIKKTSKRGWWVDIRQG